MSVAYDGLRRQDVLPCAALHSRSIAACRHYEFSAVGTAPNNLDMSSFEEMVLSSDNGYLISWRDLQELADSLDDVDRFLAVASPGVNSYKRIIENDFIDFFVKLISLIVLAGKL